MINVVQQEQKEKKQHAIALRRRGLSYSEIKNTFSIPKSTLSHWLKNIHLTKRQINILNTRRLQALQRGSQTRVSRTCQIIEEIKNASARNINKISKRELWLMGIVLYWRERFLYGDENNNDIQNGVRFASSNPYLIKLFLKWLQEIGRLQNNEIDFDIFIAKNKKKSIERIVKYWSQVTSFSEDNFSHVYLYTTRKRKTGENKKIVSKKSQSGFLRIRVKASSMLARQISGWINGICKYFWNKTQGLKWN